ncbi:MAG TPA: hypothetical protein VLK82_21220 [Candidatus Tectomicrobia bacterium]|nr:hypothetical protein [Candidatus Tectomicrobia bacterium]
MHNGRRWPGEPISEPFHRRCHHTYVRAVVPRERADFGGFIANRHGAADRFGFEVQRRDLVAIPVGVLHQPMRTALDAQQSHDPHLQPRGFQDFPQVGFGHTFA